MLWSSTVRSCFSCTLFTIRSVRNELWRGWQGVSATNVAGANPRPFHVSAASLRTVNQIIRKGPVKKRPKQPGPMSGRPQMKGIVLQVMIRKPKKPNSANRKCCRVRLSNGKELTAFIPREGHTLQEHNVVLVEGGRTKDLPGVNVRVVRGKYDCGHPIK